MKAWKLLLILFFVFVIIEGALRKWVAPGLATPLYLLKDGILLLAFGAYIMSSRSRLTLLSSLRQTALPLLLGAYGFIVLLQAFNLRSPSLVVSLFGVKSHVFYMSLLVLIPAVVAELHRPHYRLKQYIGFVAVPVLLLGIYQFSQSPGHWINRYVADTEYVGGIAGRPRITGTFSYIAGMSTFLMFNISLGLGLTIAALWRRRDLLWIAAGLLTLTLIVAPMNGSRSVFYAFAIPLPFIAYQIVKKPGLSTRVALGAVGAFIVALGVMQTDLMDGWVAFMDRMERVGSGESRIERAIRGPLDAVDAAGLLGYGVGTTHQAASQLVPNRPAGSWLPTGRVESQTTRLMLELGLIGWLVLMALKVYVMYFCYQVIDRARDSVEMTIGITAFAFTSAHLIGSVVFNATAGPLYWGLVGFAIAVWCLQQQSHGQSFTPSPQPAPVPGQADA